MLPFCYYESYQIHLMDISYNMHRGHGSIPQVFLSLTLNGNKTRMRRISSGRKLERPQTCTFTLSHYCPEIIPVEMILRITTPPPHRRDFPATHTSTQPAAIKTSSSYSQKVHCGLLRTQWAAAAIISTRQSLPHIKTKII